MHILCYLPKLNDDAKVNIGLNAATLIKKLKNKDDITQADLKQF